MPELHFTWENGIERESAACISGNKKFSSFTDEDYRDGTAVDNIRQVVTDAYHNGYRFFFVLTNYSQFELAAGEVVLELKKSYPEIQLIALALSVGEALGDELAERGKIVRQAADKKEILPFGPSRAVLLYHKYVTGICGMMIGNFPCLESNSISQAVGFARANHMEIDNRIGECLWKRGPSVEIPRRCTAIDRESAKDHTAYFCSDLTIPCGYQMETQFKETVKTAVSSSIQDEYVNFITTLDSIYQLIYAECVLEYMKQDKNIRLFIIRPYFVKFLMDQPPRNFYRIDRVIQAASFNEYYQYWRSDAVMPQYYEHLASQYSRLLYFHLEEAESQSANELAHLAEQNGTFILHVDAHEFKQGLKGYRESEETTICFYCHMSRYIRFSTYSKRLDWMKHMLEKLIAKQVKKSRRTTFVVEIRNWISFLFMELVLEASANTAIKLQYILPKNVDLGKITRDTQESYYPLSEMKIRATLKMAEPLHAKIKDWDSLASRCTELLYLMDPDKTQKDEILQAFERQGKAHSIWVKMIDFDLCSHTQEFDEVMKVVERRHGEIDIAVARKFFNAGAYIGEHW